MQSRTILTFLVSAALHALILIPASYQAPSDGEGVRWIEVAPIERSSVPQKARSTGARTADSNAPSGESSNPTATAASGETPGPEAIAYFESLRGWLVEQSRGDREGFPREGRARIRLTIEADGAIRDGSIAESSGDARLDAALLRWIARLPRFTPPSAEHGAPPLALEVPVIVPRR